MPLFLAFLGAVPLFGKELNDYDERAVLLEGIKGFLALVDANHEDLSLV